MRNIKAYKKSFDYLGEVENERYLAFLKRHFVQSEPNFYSVVSKTKVDTPDGVMYAVRINTELNDPNYEPIAECWINGYFFYLWRDLCWAIANDKNNKDIINFPNGKKFNPILKDNLNAINRLRQPCNKTLILHTIGKDPVFEESK